MFSGIVEATARLKALQAGAGVTYLYLEKPKEFDDLATGDSIAVDGVCLTVEEFDADQMRFALGPETIRVTGWQPEVFQVQGRRFNLERSLRLQDRIHGHFVTGHVDRTAVVQNVRPRGDSLDLEFELPAALKAYIWQKGSVAVNGVSLTVNACSAAQFAVGLIPETLKRTNLGRLQSGDRVNIEVDTLARALVRWAELREGATRL